MKLTREQIEGIEYEDFIKMIRDALEIGDKEFIMSAIPLLPEYDEEEHDDFMTFFDSELFEDRDIALELAKYGQDVPKDLYEDDEEIILVAVSCPGRELNGFDLASDKCLKNKNFVMRMFSNIGNYMVLEEILDYDLDIDIPKQVLEDGEIEQFIKRRIQELKEKEKTAGYEESKPLEDMTLEELQKTEQDNDERIADNNEAIRQALIQRIREQQKIIADQEAEISELKSQKKEL